MMRTFMNRLFAYLRRYTYTEQEMRASLLSEALGVAVDHRGMIPRRTR